MWEHYGKVRYYETDRMGVVHHSNYLRLVENARIDWLDDKIMPYDQMEKMGIIIPCISALGNFKRFMRFGDEYAITVKLSEYAGVRFRLDYVVRNRENDKVCYTGYSEHCFTRDGDYKPISLRKKFPEVHQRMMELLEDE